MPREPGQSCRSCVHFRNEPAYLEAAFKGLTSLSSGYASVRADDGLCLRHERYLGARSWCPEFTAARAPDHDMPRR
jgi:hypothetical protein